MFGLKHASSNEEWPRICPIFESTSFLYNIGFFIFFQEQTYLSLHWFHFLSF
jgi:hypothetical protein